MLYHYVHTSVHTTHASASSPRTRTDRSHLSRSTIPYVKSFMRSPSINYLAVTSLQPLEWQKQHHVRPVSISGTLIIDLSETLCFHKVDCSYRDCVDTHTSTLARRQPHDAGEIQSVVNDPGSVATCSATRRELH